MNLLNNRLLKTELVEWKKLIPFQPDNLKKTEPYKLQKLANSLCENGFSMNFYVWEKDGQIYIIDGHSRQEVLQLLESGAIYPKDSSGKEYQVTIPDKFPCSFLHLKNKSEAKKAVLIYNSKYKSIDSDILSEWVSDLSLDELKSQIEIPELKLDFDLGNNEEDIYSKEIKTPVYDTKNVKPNIKEVYNIEKYNKLIREIESSKLHEDEKQFLKFAATRHIVFNYELIADYYAHSEKNLQELFENSALVIIDFNKAIELGYLKIQKEIADQYGKDYE